MKYYGAIGYGETKEIRPGVWEEQIEERAYYGDILRCRQQFQAAGKVNDDMTLTNEFSILADPYALEKYAFMRYIVYGGIRWRINDVELQYPRLIIRVGGVYHG